MDFPIVQQSRAGGMAVKAVDVAQIKYLRGTEGHVAWRRRKAEISRNRLRLRRVFANALRRGQEASRRLISRPRLV